MKRIIPFNLFKLSVLLIVFCLFTFIVPVYFTVPVYSSERSVDITLVGDIFLGNWVERYIQKDPSYPYAYLSHILNPEDILIGNLESPLSLKGEVYIEKTYTLHCHPQSVKTLKVGGFDAVTLANNHIMDFGPTALFETISVLKKNEIKFAGAGADIKEARTPAFLEKNGLKIALLAYNNTLPLEFNASFDKPGTAQGRWEYIEDDVKKASNKADLVIVSFHWSAELLKEPKPYQKSLAKLCIDSGADLVFGHHPHVIQGIEIYKNRLIAYSLGNFIFGSYSKKVKDAIILRVRMDENGPTTATIFPINVNNNQVVFRPKPLSGAEATDALKEMSNLSAKLKTAICIEKGIGKIIIPNLK